MEGTLKFLTREDLHLLQPRMRLARARADQQLIKEGVLPLGLFIVRSGTVEIRRRVGNIDAPVTDLGVGEMFGEAAFLDGGAASASVFAKTDADLLLFTPDRIEPLFEQHPRLFARFFQSIALVLSRRLRAFNGQSAANSGGGRYFSDLPNWEII